MTLDRSHYAEKFKEIVMLEKGSFIEDKMKINKLTQEIIDEIVSVALLESITTSPTDTIDYPEYTLHEKWELDPEFVKSMGGVRAERRANRINREVRRELDMILRTSPSYAFVLTVLTAKLYKENRNLKQEICDMRQDIHNLKAQVRDIEQRVNIYCK